MNKKEIPEKLEEIELEEKKLKELEILSLYEKEDRVISSEEKLKELEAQKDLPVMSSCYKGLDNLIDGGFKAGELITITGITKNGKSCFARNLCSNLVAQCINSIYFSYEETERELLERFPKPYPIFYLPRKLSSQKTEWISERVGEAKAKFGIGAVMIDNLDFLLEKDIYKKFGNTSDLIKFIVLDLKNMARYWEVAVFLMAHTTQEGMRNEIDIGDLKGSSAIAQISDFVLVIKRLKNRETGLPGDKSKVQVLANRRTGRTGEIKMQFENNQLKEIEKIENESDNL